MEKSNKSQWYQQINKYLRAFRPICRLTDSPSYVREILFQARRQGSAITHSLKLPSRRAGGRYGDTE